MDQTGFVFDERYLAHDTGTESRVEMRDGAFELSPEPHPSSVVITSRTKEFLDGSGLTARMTPIAARAASEDEIAMYHTLPILQVFAPFLNVVLYEGHCLCPGAR